MAGGSGGTTKTVSEPWKGAQPFLSEAFGMARGAAGAPPKFYPGQTFAGPTSGQLTGWDSQLQYADQVFGGQAAPKFGDATAALTRNLTGNNGLGTLASQLAPSAASTIMSGFGPWGTAGGVDARGAINASLTGQPDYEGVQGAIDAANAPLLRQFNEQLIPQLNQRTTFTNNPTGAIKELNWALPQLAGRMSENALGLTNQERMRALSSRDATAQMVAQGGLQMGNNALGFGNLYGNLSGNNADIGLRAAAMFPSLAQAGAIPGQLASQFGDWAAQYPAQQVQENVNRWDFNQNSARDNAQWYANLVNGMGGLGGSSTSKQSGGGVGGVIGGGLGGALAGKALGPMLGMTGPWGAVAGAGLGILGSLF